MCPTVLVSTDREGFIAINAEKNWKKNFTFDISIERTFSTLSESVKFIT